MCAAKRSPLRTPTRWSKNQKAKKCRSAARFLTLFDSSPIDPFGANTLQWNCSQFLFFVALFWQFVGADSISARGVLRQRKIPRANTVRPYSPHTSVRRGRRCGVAQRSMPQWGIEPHERASFAGWRPSCWPPSADAPASARILRADMESAPTAKRFWPRRGQSVGRRKSVKKNAALLHFLAFPSNDLLFGVLRGERP